MKVCLALCLLSTIFSEIFCVFEMVNVKPKVSTDVNRSVTTNAVSLQMPYCYFDSVIPTKCPDEAACEIWLVSSLTSAKSNYDTNRGDSFFSTYSSAFTSTGRKYFTTKVNSVDNIPCTPKAPYNFIAGAEGACTGVHCNGALPESQNMRYVLIINGNKFLADTQWSDNVPLKQRESLGSGYAGRSGAMVVITTILSVSAFVLFILLLTTVVLVCFRQKKTTRSYEMSEQPSVTGSHRIPSYDVHHLTNASPYDNPAYEQNHKKSHKADSTLP